MKSYFPISLLFFFFSMVGLSQSSSDLHFDQLTEDDGLSNGFVTSFYQDEKGFMWFGTANSLNRYDGYQFKIWTTEENNPLSLSHPIIWTVCGSSDGFIWVGTDSGLNRFNPEIEKFIRFFHNPNDGNSLSHNLIEIIYEDKEGDLWVGTGNGLNRLQKGADSFAHFFVNPKKEQEVRGICEDKEGRLWVSSGDTLYLYNRFLDNFLPFPLPSDKEDLIRTLYVDKNSIIWVGTQLSGLYQFDTEALKFTRHFETSSNNKNSLSHNRIGAITEDENGILWIGTSGGGLNFLNPDRTIIHRFLLDNFNPVHQNFETIRGIFRDDSGNIWLGTHYGGTKFVLKNRKKFKNHSHVSGKMFSLNGTAVYGFFEKTNGEIWIPLVEKGLGLFNPQTGVFEHFNISDSLKNSNITSATEDQKGNLWLCTNDAGVWTKNVVTNEWSYLKNTNQYWNKYIFCDRQNNIWIGTMSGAFKYNLGTGTLEQCPLRIDSTKLKDGNNFNIEQIYQSSNGDIWITTHGGVNHQSKESNDFLFYPYPHQVFSIQEDHNGKIWLGTLIGLAYFDPKDEKVVSYQKTPKLVNKLIQSIIEDDKGKLWLASNSGIFRFDSATGEAIFFNLKDGLLNNQYFGARLKSSTGEIYFGGSKGFDFFHPDEIKFNEISPSVVLTNFQLFNKDVPLQHILPDSLKNTSPLSKNITYTKEIILNYWQNDFTIEFAALDFTAPENNLYQYKLEGYNTGWVAAKASNRFAHFTNMSPGHYIFKVKGSNNDGKWNTNSANLTIIILKPYWLRWWAWICYIILTFSFLFWLRNYELDRQLAKSEAKRLQELDQIKTRLYTNITHEFRTPLTIILGMADQLKIQVFDTGKEGLSMIKRNGRELLQLVNQMLDLSKLESGGIQLDKIQADVIPYLKYIVESFHSLAENKQINLKLECAIDELWMDFEPLRLREILGNLISNGLKFTPEKGRVIVEIKQSNQTLKILVEDTGIGISASQLPLVFDRFYQVDSSSTRQTKGTGLGLAISSELVKLMGGHISVESTPGKGSTFIFFIPITQNMPLETPRLPQTIKDNQEASVMPIKTRLEASKKLPLLLLIEDNNDVVRYLESCIGNLYQIQVAKDGKEGIQKAIELIPDFIISDVMMPYVDGFEVCETLKMDKRTSHIPIIMLTAKADIQSKLQGLKVGADAYLPKPFNERELLVRIEKMLELRRNLQGYYLSLAESSKGQYKNDANKLDSIFVQKIRDVVLEHINDTSFSVGQLSKKMGLSRSQLHRKIKALTAYSTGQFIRYIRLAKAKQLLLKPDLNIAEIAYDTGFADPDYFSKVFKSEFGMTPTMFRNSSREL